MGKIKLKYRKGIFLVAYSIENNKIKYLILKRKLHWKGWEFPKGGVEKGENLIRAVKREIKEETGLKPIKIKKYNSKGIYRYDKTLEDRPEMKGQTFSLFSTEIPYGKIKIDKIEHSGYKWLGFKDAMKKLTWKNQKKCLNIVNKWLKK